MAVSATEGVAPSRVLLVASSGAFLTFLDATIVNVAFPSIRESFAGTSIGQLSWVLNSYNIVFAAFLIVSVSIRHARNIVAPVNVKGVWAGLPRSVLGFWAIAYCNATLAPHTPGGWWFGVVLIPLLSMLTLTYLPFPSHRIARKHRFGFYVVATGFRGTASTE